MNILVNSVPVYMDLGIAGFLNAHFDGLVQTEVSPLLMHCSLDVNHRFYKLDLWNELWCKNKVCM